MTKINKKTLLKLRDEDKLSFVAIATQFNCSKQGVHNMYYREKVKELLPIIITEALIDNERLETIEDVRKELIEQDMTLTYLVNEVIERRFIEGRQQ